MVNTTVAYASWTRLHISVYNCYLVTFDKAETVLLNFIEEKYTCLMRAGHSVDCLGISPNDKLNMSRTDACSFDQHWPIKTDTFHYITMWLDQTTISKITDKHKTDGCSPNSVPASNNARIDICN
jgi:hypothetical protein